MNRSATLPTLAALTAALFACAPPGPAEAPAPTIARDAAAASRVSAPGTATPDETGRAAAVFTAAQADRGRAIFRSTCSECHYSSEFRGSQFQFAWSERSVADLYREIARNMPEDAPGSLSPQEYVDVVSYILQLNGFPAGTVELTDDEAAMSAVGLRASGGSAGGFEGRLQPPR